LAKGKAFLLDTDLILETTLSLHRMTLSPYDIASYRILGSSCGAIVSEVCKSVQPNMTEWQVGALMSQKCIEQGIEVVVMLIAADERLENIRHPLPTMKKIKKKVMVVLCGRRGGLIASVTRIVYISNNPNESIPDDLRKRHNAVTYVDAIAMSLTKPGAISSGIFKAIQGAYKEKGFENEWKYHHQGGLAGYKSREWKASPISNVQSFLRMLQIDI